ncbi:MAG: 4'-phosphopantetheinyl transferase superfamily protein [Cyclobacteriaceae bacterium]
MIGIDIVDLTDPLFRERTSRSLDLISGENDRLIDHPNLFWLLWSAKEAVFKTKREIKSFAPRDIPISLRKEGSKIKFESDGIEGEILVSEKNIFSIAGDNQAFEYSVVNEKSNNWSTTIRKRITTHFSEKGIAASVTKSGRLPMLNDRLPISISHHGEFAAFAYPKSILKA